MPTYRKISDFLQEHRDEIVVRWAKQVAESPETRNSVKGMADLTLRNAIPDFLLHLAEWLETESNRPTTGYSQVKGAVEHATARLAVGFDLRSVIFEYMLLRSVVVEMQFEYEGCPEALVDRKNFNRAIDYAILEATERFHTERMKDVEFFASMIAHDIHNAMATARMAAEVLLRQGNLSDRVRSPIARISRVSERVTRFTEQLLTLAHVRVGSLILDREPMDLRDVVMETVEEVQIAHPDKDLRIDVKGDTTGKWDLIRMEMLVQNLLGNAVKHGWHSPIWVFLEGNEWVHLSVANKGAAMPRHELKKLFDPYARAEHRPVGGGYGLGLAIVGVIVRAHKGSVDVETTDGDTKFTVKLPRDTQPTEAEAKAEG